jgi:Bardet-Biedl syndrome 4 protein
MSRANDPASQTISGDTLSQAIEANRSTLFVKMNWQIHASFLRRDFTTCSELIEDQLRATNGQSEYALYMKAMIMRLDGNIHDSLMAFQAALCLNPANVANLKQVGQSLHLMGKHKTALDVFEEAEQLAPEDRDIFHNKGVCHLYMKQFDKGQ